MLLDPPGLLRLDPLILPFVQASEAESEAALASLLTAQALPVVQAILGQRQGGPDRADLEGEVLVRLIERLHRLRRGPAEDGIRDFRGYVAVVTYNVAAGQARRRELERGRAPGEDDDPLARLPDPAPDAALALERRTNLSRLWDEIRQLPKRQAAALILHLQDGQGRNAAALLPLTGTASLRDIARAVGLEPERLAEIWNYLPLEDTAIAAVLRVTRQQVINLRKSARERLARRIARSGERLRPLR
jgi:DNA-directed RNA polymerase specialized sigma24 family protein